MTLESATTGDGETVYIDTSTAERGSAGAFHPVFSDPDGTNRWGYYCSGCEGFDNAIDTMGRIVCNGCENVRKPDEWDAVNE
jgi:hypothetical protein